jgi:uroporphyrinogen decarboxylase
VCPYLKHIVPKTKQAQPGFIPFCAFRRKEWTIYMSKIIKAPETMSAKERVARTFKFEKTDRVTIGYESNPVAEINLCSALGIPHGDILLLRKTLGVDYAGVMVEYTGPELYTPIPDRKRDAESGFVTRYIENQYGAYWDICDFPLQDANDEDIINYPFPDPDHYNYEAAEAEIDALIKEGFAIHAGNCGVCDIINSTGRLMGMEDALVNIHTGDDATLKLIDNRLNSMFGVLRQLLERNKGKFDFLWLGEDLGTQHAPLISIETYRKYLRPRHQRFIDLAKTYDLPIIIHTCGASSWVYEDLIEMGMTGVDTLQPEAAGMSPVSLCEGFGGRLNFRGCVSTAGPLAYGTAQETDDICRETLQIMKEQRGYHFAPTHLIQDNTPADNIIAMYNAAHKYGVY